MVAAATGLGLQMSGPAASAARVGGPAPGGPGVVAPYLPADKPGFGTARGTASNVWYTLQPGGRTGEIYYPDLSTPAARTLGFVVVDRAGRAVQVADAATHHTTLADGRSLSYRSVDTEKGGRWRLTTTYTTDSTRPTLAVDISFASLDSRPYQLYAIYEPTLSNTPADDSGSTSGTALLSSDGTSASALVAIPAFTATSSGFRGTSDGWTDLSADGRLDWRYTSAGPGSIVQTGRMDVTGLSGHRHVTLALGFAGNSYAALAAARATGGRSFPAIAAAYAAGWHRYLDGLRRPPTSLRTAAERQAYLVSAMVLAASEDKIHRGAYVASPTMPWVWGTDNPSGPYHLVWSRDLYEIATALIAQGDRAGADRALTYLFGTQQKPDGSFPQNSTTDGTPFWGGLQLDEVADPIVLAYQLGRSDPATWAHVKAAADFLVGFSQDGYPAPYSPQDRWENQSGYSPASIASQIAGLVCAAHIAQANSDPAAARRYLHAADAWKAHVKAWTVTTNGPYSAGPYFLRVTKDGHPNRGTTYSIGDSGPSAIDQRKVVDPSFLELVRLGVLPADDRAVVNSLRVIDAKLAVDTPRGRFWHRASFDGYGETRTGAPWNFDNPSDSFITLGRAWPLLNGERGEYDLLAGAQGAAGNQLATMAGTVNAGYLMPEQVWDNRPPAGRPGFAPGTPTTSATPLAWTHAQYIRLARDVEAGTVLEQPAVVAQRYLGGG